MLRMHVHASAGSTSLNRLAFSATLHCLTGCAIGEVLGMVIGTALACPTSPRSRWPSRSRTSSASR